MTEAEWLACQEPEAMLRFAAHHASLRKERLFAVACCRRVDHLLSDYCRELISRVESAADHPLTGAAGDDLINDAMAHADGLSYHCVTPLGSARWTAANAVWYAAEGRAIRAADYAVDAAAAAELGAAIHVNAPGPPTAGAPGERAAQADLVRHIFGNPFRSVAVDPAWLTSTVVALGRLMYESRDFSAMPVLADALQDAGCDCADVLTHCREPAAHVRGCWVVDVLLGKL